MSAANVAAIVSKQSATAVTVSTTLSYTPTVSGMYRLNGYGIIYNATGASYTIGFEWTDSHHSWSWAPGDGPGVVGIFSEPKSVLVYGIAGSPIGIVFTISSGTPSADLFLVVEDLN